VSGAQSIALGAVLGVARGIASAFAGYQVRTHLVKDLKVPDLVIALLEDAGTIDGGFFVVSRFQLRDEGEACARKLMETGPM
jgi:uncharacterized membrane protein